MSQIRVGVDAAFAAELVCQGRDEPAQCSVTEVTLEFLISGVQFYL